MAKRQIGHIFRRVRRIDLKILPGQVLFAVLLVYLALTILHLMQGFSFGSALQGGIQDFRAFGACWGEWGEMKEFVGREAFFGADVGKVALDLGEVCR